MNIVSMCVRHAMEIFSRLLVKRRLLRVSAAAIVLMAAAATAHAEDQPPRKPAPGDKCPVCGMFVAKYPDWIAEIIFADGSAVFFDGAKDLFKYYFDLNRYDPRKTAADISNIYVTDYYEMELIDAKRAFFVIGSDVYGPMGRELIPFQKESDAGVFLTDHHGLSIVPFERIKPTMIKKLD